jgi:hypothetical protein
MVTGFTGPFAPPNLWLQFTFHYYTHTHTHSCLHSHVFPNHCLVASSNGGCSHSFQFSSSPWLQLPAFHSTAQMTEPQQFTNSRTNSMDWQTSHTSPLLSLTAISLLNSPGILSQQLNLSNNSSCLYLLGIDHAENTLV